MLRTYANRVLDEGADYTGQVGAVAVSLWRGAYVLEDVSILKRGHAVPVPFLECPRIDCSIEWRALLHGVARAQLVLDRPALNFVAGPTPEQTQTGADAPWLSVINDLSPFRIDRAQVKSGTIRFHAFHTSPQVHVHLTEVNALLTNLTNIRDDVKPLVAEIHGTAVAMESGRLEFDMECDPEAHFPTFALATRLLGLDVNRLNSLARAYGDFDFESGRFDLVVEASAHQGRIEGYAKPLFRHVIVVGPRDVRRGDPLQLLWQSLVGIAGAVFKNQDRDQFGTRIDFDGDLNDPHISILEAVGNVLRNAFVRAYLPRFEGKIAPAAAPAAAEHGETHEGPAHEHP